MRLPSCENVTKNRKETAGTEMNPEVEGVARKVTPSKYRSVEKELAIQREGRESSNHSQAGEKVVKSFKGRGVSHLDNLPEPVQRSRDSDK